MTKHTARDEVWGQVLQRVLKQESFRIEDLREAISDDVSDRTIHDTLKAMADQGWLSKETPQADEWAPGSQVCNKEVDKEDSPEDPSPPDVTTVSSITEGEVYSGEIDRISSGGNGIISIDQSHLNLGPIDPSAAGEKVEFEYLEGLWAKCLTDKYIDESYSPYDGKSPRSFSHNSKSSSSSSHDGKYGMSPSSSSKRHLSKNNSSKNPDNKNKLLRGKL